MQIIYIDRISISSLFALGAFRSKCAAIYFFDKAAISDTFIDRLIKLKLLRSKPLPVQFMLGEIKDAKGESLFIKISEDVTALCGEISDKEFKGNGFLRSVAGDLDFNKLRVFFEKTVHQEINGILIFIHAARWHTRTTAGHTVNRPRFFMAKDTWSAYVSAYANSLGVDLIEYRSFMGPGPRDTLSKVLRFMAANLRSIRELFKIRAKKRAPETRTGRVDPVPRNTPLLASWYTGKTITFDLHRRSDFFWLLKTSIPRQRVLVYFDRTDIPLAYDMAELLRKEGVQYIALSDQARTSKELPLWRAGADHSLMFRSLAMKIINESLFHMMQFHRVTWFLIKNMLIFAWQFSYWHDFFKSNGVKVNVDPNDFTRMSVCEHLALEHNQGVSISYQWSNLSFASPLFSSAASVLFSFGPEYKKYFEASRTAVDNIVYCGYITDYAFSEVKNRSSELRSDLHNRGVKFIICYFDENSSDDRMSVIPNTRSAEIYKFLIDRMLQDESLGLIFKPGYPKTLFQRLSSISDLIDKAKTSGRCIFMDKGTYVTEQYPAEAAQAADLCIGLLLSGTVALESHLTGRPAIFIDLESLYSNPLYQTGKGTIVFDDLEEMFTAITRFRENADSIPGFGDLSEWARERDPYKDGNASLRMGQYIGWLLEMVDQGRSREEAMYYADRKYRETWGAQSIDHPRIAG